jgi:hypothetical protein
MTETLPPPPPHIQMIQMATGYWLSRVVYTAAKLGIADLLASGPRPSSEIAQATGTAPRALHRMLRTLAGFGVLTQHDDGRFALTELGETLKSGAPGAARSTVLTMAGPWAYGAFGELEYSLRTGRTAFEKVMGMPLFDYLAAHPDEAAQFSEAMVGIHGPEPPAVADAYDFSSHGTVVDVGGATGNMLAAILSKYPQPRGVLFDRSHVLSAAPALLGARGVADRVRLEEGNFFERVPGGGDLYILSHIIHDWTDAQCLTILGNCRAAMPPAATLLIVEFVLPEGDTPHLGKLTDMVMLTMPGGEERTAVEYETLLSAAGFRMNRVIPTASNVSIVEAHVA